jgi:hypothetical protein
MKEFQVSNSMDPIEFKIGNDIFKAIASDQVPGNIIIRYAEQAQAGKLYEAVTTFFARVLEPESADLFSHRMDSKDNPITLDVLLKVVEWLMEQYTNLTTSVS